MTKSDILKRIRAKCLDCGAGSSREVELCPVPGCALHDLRFGKDPTRRRLSPEEAATLSERLRQSRTKNKLTHTVEKNSPEGK